MAEIEMHPIESSAITHHGYDPESQIMHVKTHNGFTYEYEGVSPEKYAAFTGARSAGAFWNKEIVGKHQGRKL